MGTVFYYIMKLFFLLNLYSLLRMLLAGLGKKCMALRSDQDPYSVFSRLKFKIFTSFSIFIDFQDYNYFFLVKTKILNQCTNWFSSEPEY